MSGLSAEELDDFDAWVRDGIRASTKKYKTAEEAGHKFMAAKHLSAKQTLDFVLSKLRTIETKENENME